MVYGSMDLSYRSGRESFLSRLVVVFMVLGGFLLLLLFVVFCMCVCVGGGICKESFMWLFLKESWCTSVTHRISSRIF